MVRDAAAIWVPPPKADRLKSPQTKPFAGTAGASRSGQSTKLIKRPISGDG